MDVDSYIGVVAPFAGSFAPKNWMTCNGQQILIAQNQTLYSLLGTVYGGDGINTFCLPNLGGRVAMGQSANLPLGAVAGTEQITLLPTNLPYHTHGATAEATVLLRPAARPAPARRRPAIRWGSRWAPVGVTPSRCRSTVLRRARWGYQCRRNLA